MQPNNQPINSAAHCLNESCTICLCPLKSEESEIILSCSHGYHVDCLKYWTRQHEEPTCPICRRPLFFSDRMNLPPDAHYVAREYSISGIVGNQGERDLSLEFLRESLTQAENDRQIELVIRNYHMSLADDEIQGARGIEEEIEGLRHSSLQAGNMQARGSMLQNNLDMRLTRLDNLVIPAMERFHQHSLHFCEHLRETIPDQFHDLESTSDMVRYSTIIHFGICHLEIARNLMTRVKLVRDSLASMQRDLRGL